MKIVCDNKIPFLQGVFEPYAEVVYLPGRDTTAELVRDADAIVTRTRTKCDAALLEGSSVKVIATATIGFDHIDTTWCEGHGILWRNAPGCNSWSVKQYAASLFAFLRHKYGFAFSDLTLGVVGVGNVGSKVAQVGRALGMKVLLNDPPRERREGPEQFCSLDKILEQSDIITLHVPLIRCGEDATWHLFDEAMIDRLKPGQILINAARGPVVDDSALKSALKRGSIRGAVIDCWEGEPDLDPELVDLLDITTPHIAGYSADGKANGTIASVHTVAEVLGLPLTDWKPEFMPLPPQPLRFGLDASGKSRDEVLCEAIEHTYKVEEDSDLLRDNLDSFERLRGDYRIRREMSCFTIDLKGASDDCAEALRKLDFKLVIQ